jgi:pilus assembly protein CpaE
MRVDLLASSDNNLALAQGVISSSGHVLSRAFLRGQALDLAAQLATCEADVLVLESPLGWQAADLRQLEQLLARKPLVQVIWLTEEAGKDELVRAMRNGVREVLNLPLHRAELLQALARVARRPAQADDTQTDKTQLGSAATRHRMIAFLPAKGGSGATLVSTQVAERMAAEFGRHCALLDLDLQCGDASFALSSGQPAHALTELTQHTERLDAQLLQGCMHAVRPGLALLAAPTDPQASWSVTPAQLQAVLTLARESYDTVLLDLGCSWDALSLQAVEMADEVVIVAQNLLPHVRDAQRLVGILRALGCDEGKLRLVLNRFDPDSSISAAHVQAVVGLPVYCTLPDRPAEAAQSVNLGKPLGEVARRSELLQALRLLSAQLLDVPAPREHGWMQRWMGKVA